VHQPRELVENTVRGLGHACLRDKPASMPTLRQQWRSGRAVARLGRAPPLTPLQPYRITAAAAVQQADSMPLALLTYPKFDPVLVHLGPFAIRWYALSYIAGILLGWLYARMLVANERYWGGPAPLTALDLDDFVLWVTLDIILGGRLGYVLFYNLDHFIN